MIKKNESFDIQSRHFRWVLKSREGVWQADGRGNKLGAGRHSLRTRDLSTAKKVVHKLDEKMAEKLGLIRFARRENDVNFKLSIQQGVDIYFEFIERPKIAGGIADSTRKRYKRSINTFISHVESAPIQYWEQFDSPYLTNFIKQLGKKYKRSSIVTIATTVRTLHRHLIINKHLDDRCAFPFTITRPKESSKYCPIEEELRAILANLQVCQWMFDSTATLSHSGLRFGELAQLSRFDADLKKSLIFVRDETFDSNSNRTTKSGYSRAVPMHPVVKEIIKRRLKLDQELLFVGPRGGKLRSDTYGRNLRKLALEPLGEKFPHPKFQTITAHSLRHFFASMCAANKVSEQTTMDWMGHRTSNMAKYYYRSNHKAAVQMIQQFEDFTEASPADDVSKHNPKSETGNDDTEQNE